MAERCYVYAIIPANATLPTHLAGFGGPLRSIAQGELAAAVSPVERDDLSATPEHLLRHERTVEAVRATNAALPVRFGTVMEDEGALRRALTEQYDSLRADLARLGDKLELGVTALWGDAPSSEAAHPNGGERVHSEAATPAEGRGSRYLRARMATYRREESLRQRAERLAAEIDAALCPHALEHRRSLCPSAGLALRNVYLVDPERLGAFVGAFDALRERRLEARLLLSGPWPPYSFVTGPRDLARQTMDQAASRLSVK
jgi:gas vesicle protein GvpL/GvpF